MKIKRLFRTDSELSIDDFMTDSRCRLENSLFFCLKGMVHDGHQFVDQAISNGAIAVVHSDELPLYHDDILYIRVQDVLLALNESARIFYGDPSHKMMLVGVTGTNGKSTIAKTFKDIYNHFKPCGYSGTISIEYGTKKEKPDYTTAETVPTLKMLNRMLDEGMKAAALEISSQGLDQKRADALSFDIAIFTNLTHDHLDYHGNLENYYQAKKLLFKLMKDEGCSVVNLDDPYGKRLYTELSQKKVSYSLYENADYRIQDIILKPNESSFNLKVEGKVYPCKTNLVAAFNLSNLCAVIASLHLSGIDIEEIIPYLEKLPQVEGRMEVIEEGQNFNVVVDYAHTPDGFEKIYQFARSITPEDKRIITVFGSAGKRDRKKRRILGEISDRYAHMIILTEEDPRDESSLEIAKEISDGIKYHNFTIILDRYDAIRQALEIANAGDTVLILAKGNERYITRQFGKEYWMGDDVATRQILRSMKNGKDTLI